jgi:hypothetical protein
MNATVKTVRFQKHQDVVSWREVRVTEPLLGFDLDPHQLPSCYRQKRRAEAAERNVLLRMAPPPLHREFTSEVDAAGRPREETLVRARYAVGACVRRCQSIRSASCSASA